MPYRSNIPCKHPGCAALIPHGQMYCEEHKPLHTKDRAHAAERGYGAKWQRERRKFLESNPFCVKCYEEGHITMATVVDHIVPLVVNHTVETRNSFGIGRTGSLYVSIIIM